MLEEMKDIQIGDIPLVFRGNIDPMSIRQEIDRFEIIHEPSRIYHRNTSIKPCNLV